MVGVDTWLSRSQGLVADLGDAGLSTGLGEQLKVLRLLQLLEERGHAPKSVDELAHWVAPILCSRADQVEPLHRVLTSHFNAAAHPIAGRLNARLERVGSSETRRFSLHWTAVLSAMVGIIIIAVIYYVARGALQFPDLVTNVFPFDTPGTQTSTSSVIVQSGIAATLLTAVAAFVIWRRINLALHHGRVTEDAATQQVRVDEPEQDKDNPHLLSAARMLNRPQLRPTGKLDVPMTVRATAEAGGRFSPAEEIKRIPATWMLLVERGGPEDPMPEFGARLSVVLARSGVRHTLYEFRRSPEWVRRKDRRDGPRGMHMPLERALANDRPTRVLMLAEATTVVDERTGGAARWLIEHDLPPPVLLTPNAMQTWSAKESAASQAGVLVLPADPEGLASLARRMQAGDLEPKAFPPAQQALFDRWQDERFTWLSQTEPDAAEREKLLDSLRELLGKNPKEFRLLVGVAAFPQVRLDLMATLDRKLHPHDNASDRRFRLLKLGRLVWLKEGIIPDWLRRDLMRALPRIEVRQVREAWMELLADKPAPGKPGSTLDIHLAEGTAEKGAQGDGLFLGFLRGEFDLRAPLRWAGLAALWRAPDRTELVVAGAGVAGVIGAFLSDVDLGAHTENALRAWYESMRTFQLERELLWLRHWMLAGAFLPIFAGVIWFSRVLQGRTQSSPFATHAALAIAAALITSAAGWLSYDFGLPFQLRRAALALLAPLVVAGSVALLITWPVRTAKPAALELSAIVQRGRGTGLSDSATMLALLWLLVAGLLLGVGARDVSQQLTSASLVAIAVLGLCRATLIWWSDARLQPPLLLPADAARDAALGLVLGQLAGAALAEMLTANASLVVSFESLNESGIIWFLGSGLMLFGSAVGVSVTLLRYRLGKEADIFWAGAAALGAQAAQLALGSALGAIQYVSIAILVIMLPVVPAAMLARVDLTRIKARGRVLAAAFVLLSLPPCFLSFWVWWSLMSVEDTAVIVPLVATTVATWPLLQYALTDEPSPAGEPAHWRARPAPPVLWAFAPLVLVTALQFPIGPLAVDLPSLVIPLAILLAWRFGLRGYRTVLLMVLPALWFYVPLLLSWVVIGPFKALLPAPSQFALPASVAPVTLDVAASALIVAALFARPMLFWQIRVTSRIPVWAAGALILVLCLQVSIDRSDVETIPNTQQQGIGGKDIGDTPPTQQAIQAPIRPDDGKGSQAVQAPSGGANYSGRPGQASNYGSNVWLGWSPGTLVVLMLFLLAVTEIRGRGILTAVGVAGVVSVALGFSGVRLDAFLLLSIGAALAGLAAYGAGRYFLQMPHAAEISHDRAAVEAQHVKLKWRDYVALVVLYIAISVATGSLLIDLPADAHAASFAFTILLAFIVGVRLRESAGWRWTGIILLGLFGIYGAIFVSVLLPSVTQQPVRPPGALLAHFLPLVLFVVGTRCGHALMRPAPDPRVAPIFDTDDDEWMKKLFGPLGERTQQAAADGRARAASVLQRIGLVRPKEISVEVPVTGSDVTSATGEQSVATPEPAEGPDEPPPGSDFSDWARNKARAAHGRDDWSFTVAISQHPLLPSWPGADTGAFEFRRWVTSPSGGGVPEEQTAIWANPPMNSATDVKERLGSFIRQSIEARGRGGRAPRRLYLYFAGFIFVEGENVFLAAPSGTTDAPASPINLKAWADDICRTGQFAEVLMFIDGRRVPTDFVRGQAHQLPLPPSGSGSSKTSHFYVIALDQDDSTTKDGDVSSFAIELINGLMGSATNTSGRVTTQLLQTFLARRLMTTTSLRYDGDVAIDIAEVTPRSAS